MITTSFFRIKLRVIATLLLPVISYASMAQTIYLPNECKLKIGDNPAYASPAYNDADWQMKKLPSSWKTSNMVKDVFGWARIKVVIPAALKEIAEKENGLTINLGKIDDVDETYFNGKLIGHGGSFPPNYVSNSKGIRKYIIPFDLIHWDTENLIAVRVFSPDILGVGMYDGPYTISPYQWFDEIKVNHEIKETAPKEFISEYDFINNGDKAFDGIIKYSITNNKNNVLFSEEKSVHLGAGKGAKASINFSKYKASNDQFVIVHYEISDKNSPAQIVKSEQKYLADKNVSIPVGHEVKPCVQNKIASNFNAIPFQNEHFNGYLNTRFTQNLEERLLKVDEFGLMGSYLQRPGIHPWAGEHVGKYLETACNVWKLTHNEALKKQMDRMMYELINTQLPDGYLGTYVPKDYWTSWDVWSHKYNVHGLLAYYSTFGYKPALEACKKMGDLLCRTFGKKAGQRDIITAGEHMGMAATSVLDAMVELYKFTGDKKYLDFCYYILDAWEQENGPKVISAILATGKVTKVGNGKAYEMLSNCVGVVKLYQVTGDEKLLKAATMAWQDVVTNRLYITGTTSSYEHFQGDDVLPATNKDNMGEGCVTTTWIQLNQNLFNITGDIKYLNELEKSVYNHLLGAENPQTGCVSYYTPLMNQKPYTCYITCCQSSVPRGIALVPGFTFGNIKNIPTILFYEPATYKETVTTFDKKKVDLSLRAATSFPANGDVIVTVNVNKIAKFPIALRVPIWSANFTATVGGKTFQGKANEYVNINKVWKNGDKIKIHFDMPIQTLYGGKSYPNRIAFQRGPQVLAYDVSINKASVNEAIANADQNISVKRPGLIAAENILPNNWIGKQAYFIDGINKDDKIYLVPFADASQTEGDMKVWLPLSTTK